LIEKALQDKTGEEDPEDLNQCNSRFKSNDFFVKKIK